MLVGCVLVSAVIWWLFARVMTAKTLKGARIHIAVLGFQEFMNRVDADRLEDACRPTRLKNFCLMRWRSAWNTTGRRPSPAS